MLLGAAAAPSGGSPPGPPAPRPRRGARPPPPSRPSPAARPGRGSCAAPARLRCRRLPLQPRPPGRRGGRCRQPPAPRPPPQQPPTGPRYRGCSGGAASQPPRERGDGEKGAASLLSPGSPRISWQAASLALMEACPRLMGTHPSVLARRHPEARRAAALALFPEHPFFPSQVAQSISRCTNRKLQPRPRSSQRLSCGLQLGSQEQQKARWEQSSEGAAGVCRAGTS